MGLRTASAALAVAAATTLLLAGPASAEQSAWGCPDFPTRAAAQAALDMRLADPDRLDPNQDGVACESRLGEPAASDERPTGDGGGAAAFAFLLGGIGAGVLGAGSIGRTGGLRRRLTPTP